MIKSKTDTYYQEERSINKKSCIFFWQRWCEALEPRTLSSYQYTLLNTYCSIAEVINVIDKIFANAYPTADNYVACIKELLRIAKNDTVIKGNNKYLYNNILSIAGNNCIKSLDDKAKAKLLYVKTSLISVLKILDENYIDWIFKDLKEHCDNENFNQLDVCLKILISQCINNGWSARALYEFEFYKPGYIEDLDKLKAFLFSHECTYVVFVDSFINDEDDLLEKIDLSIVNYDEMDTFIKSHSDTIVNPAKKERMYFRVEVTAKDNYSATLKALETLKSKMSLMHFYNKINNWRINDLVCISFNVQSSYIKKINSTQLYKAYQYVENVEHSSKIFDSMIGIFNKEEEVFKSTQKTLTNVYSYIGIGRSAFFQEEQYINMWIALETVMNTGIYSNIISHIKEVLPPVLCKRYVARIIRNYYEDCLRCEMSIDALISDDDKATCLINYFTDDAKFTDLENLVKSHTLLHYRTLEIKELLSDENILFNKITKFTETIEWHVQRLYRIRNDLAHDATFNENSLIRYIEHLYDFIAVLLTEIIHTVSQGKIIDVIEVLSYLKNNHICFLENYKNNNENKIHKSLKETGIIDMF